jgi:hypothetical protein
MNSDCTIIAEEYTIVYRDILMRYGACFTAIEAKGIVLLCQQLIEDLLGDGLCVRDLDFGSFYWCLEIRVLRQFIFAIIHLSIL